MALTHEQRSAHFASSKGLKNFYLTLNVAHNASSKDIREAYIRLKNTYSSTNQALYSLLEDAEVNETLSEVEEAYNVLSDCDLRSAFDRELLARQLVRPEDLRTELHGPGPRSRAGFEEGLMAAQRAAPAGDWSSEKGSETATIARTYSVRPTSPKKAQEPPVRDAIAQMIAQGDPSDGKLFRQIREYVGIAKEEIQEHLKISVGYVDYLEHNRFELLPQPVYVRGFLKSYLKYVGVQNSDLLVNAYVERFKAWMESKNSSF